MHCSVTALTKHDLARGLPDYVNEGSTLFAIPLSAHPYRHTFTVIPFLPYLIAFHLALSGSMNWLHLALSNYSTITY